MIYNVAQVFEALIRHIGFATHLFPSRKLHNCLIRDWINKEYGVDGVSMSRKLCRPVSISSMPSDEAFLRTITFASIDCSIKIKFCKGK